MQADFYAFLKECGYVNPPKAISDEDGSFMPYYVTRIKVGEGIDTVEKIDKLIFFAARDNERGILVFSVTEKDKNHKLFREVASQYEGVTITECQSRWHGSYKCWMICIPTE